MLSYAAEVGKDEGFNPPDAGDFNLPPFIEGNEFATKPILLVFLSVILISIFFILSSRKAALVPSKLQFAGESVYSFVRNDLGREVIGHEFMRFVPYLFTLFTFILVNNVFRARHLEQLFGHGQGFGAVLGIHRNLSCDGSIPFEKGKRNYFQQIARMATSSLNKHSPRNIFAACSIERQTSLACAPIRFFSMPSISK